MKKILKKITSKKRYIALIVIVLFLLINFFRGNGGEIEKRTVEEKTFVQETRVSGQVVAEEEALLGFASNGRISELLVNIGDSVVEGQVLARLDQSSASASVDLAQSDVSYEMAKLSDVISGTQEDVRTQENTVSVKGNNLRVAENKLVQEVRESLRVSEDSVRLKTDILFDDPDGYSKVKNFSGDLNLKDDINEERRDFDILFKKWNKALEGVNNIDAVTEDVIDITNENLDRVAKFIDLLVKAMPLYEVGSLTRSEIDANKVVVSGARTQLDSQINDFSSALNSYKSAVNELDTEKNKLDILLTSSSASDVNAQQARLSAEQARLRSATTLISDSTIRAPFDGVIVESNVEEGETIISGDIVLSVVTGGEYKIESYIPEVFIGDVSKGDVTRIIFDAYPKQVFDGQVEFVEPKQTERDGISTYKTTISFDSRDSLIRLGMTVDVTVVTKEIENALSVPSDYIVIENAKTYILVERGDEEELVEVDLGGIDSEGNQEVISGLTVGDVVIKHNE